MNYRINIKPRAEKDLARLPSEVQDRIAAKIDALSLGLAGDIKRLTNHSPAYRLRVGDYRVLFDIINDRIEIESIVHRKDAYGRS